MLVTSAIARRRYSRLTKALEWPMALLALAVIPALLLDNGSAMPRTHMMAMAVNWFVWIAFCAEFVATECCSRADGIRETLLV